VILPAVAVGNVGQLCMDVLLCSYEVTKVGYFHDRNLLPMVANDVLAARAGAGEIAVNVEVYQCPSRKLLLIQQRAPVAKGKSAEYVANLLSWFKEIQVSQIILLASAESLKRGDRQLQGPPLRYFVSPRGSDADKLAQTLQWEWMGERQPSETAQPSQGDRFARTMAGLPEDEDVTMSTATSASPSSSSSSSEDQKNPRPHIDGGGVTRELYQQAQAASCAVLGLCMYSSEGNNAMEGVTMASLLHAFLEKSAGRDPSSQTWNVPEAWSHVFDSNTDDSNLYL